MDSKSNQIAYQVAFKAAVELIASGKVVLDDDQPISDEVLSFSDAIFEQLAARLNAFEGQPVAGDAPVTPISAAPSYPAPSGTTNLDPCPECAAANPPRNGIKVHNDSGRGPEWACSLRSSEKVGGKFVETGPCAWKDWGANGKRF